MNPRRPQTLLVSAFFVMTVVACASSTSDELAGQALTNQTKKDSGTAKPDTGAVVAPVVVDSAVAPIEVDAGETPVEDASEPVDLDSGTSPTGDAPACSSTLISQIGNIGICVFLGQLCRTVSSCSQCNGPSSGALIGECCFDGAGSKTCIIKP